MTAPICPSCSQGKWSAGRSSDGLCDDCGGRTSRATLDARWKDALYRTYASIGGDAWGERTPSEREFVDVVLDCLDAHGGLTREELQAFWDLPRRERRRLALSVGP